VATIGSKARPKIESAQYEQKNTLDIPFRPQKTNKHLYQKADGPGRLAIFLGVFDGDHSSGIPFATFRLLASRHEILIHPWQIQGSRVAGWNGSGTHTNFSAKQKIREVSGRNN
jgi:hypothetical protein